MKKSTCKILFGLAILWLIIISLITLFSIDKYIPLFNISFIQGLLVLMLTIFLLGIPSWILLVLAWAKWKSEDEHKDVKEAQLEALRRGNVNVELKGKMRKLK